MLRTDKKNFPDYEYCSIAKSKEAPKDTKIQFVAIVLTRPVVSPDQKVTWSVADRSGVVSSLRHFICHLHQLAHLSESDVLVHDKLTHSR